uniref:mRNA decay activator protein ZFP36 n=1 Tax=Periophthalmus magnuspinnatus TaxID=409849 RepID=A0A3B4ABX7_9GOBI
MSLTDSSSLLATLGQLKSLEGFPSGPSTTVAPPPGFAPSANLQAQMQPMLASNRYKTELCRGFQETGSCKYGNKCQFAHGEAELRGLYRHPKYKTEPCRTFYNFGYCPYGSRCHFIHEEKIESPLSPQLPNSTQWGKTELCRSFTENGLCKYGSKCQHPKYKTEPCRTFHTIGFCPYGIRCHFVHNNEEERKQSISRSSSSSSSSSTGTPTRSPPGPAPHTTSFSSSIQLSSLPSAAFILCFHVILCFSPITCTRLPATGSDLLTHCGLNLL